MENVFYIRFVDSARNLSAENGIPLDLLGRLITAMESLIDPNDESKSFIREIKSDSYGVAIASTTELRNNKLSVIHKRIESGDYDPGDKKVYQYAKYISDIIKLYPNTVIETYPNGKDSMLESKISKIELEAKGFFQQYTMVSGILSEIGGKSLTATPHIYIDGYPNKIHIHESQEKQLAAVFKGNSITVKIRENINPNTGKSKKSTLEEIIFKSNHSFTDGISKLNDDDLKFLDGINSIDDILEN